MVSAADHVKNAEHHIGRANIELDNAYGGSEDVAQIHLGMGQIHATQAVACALLALFARGH